MILSKILNERESLTRKISKDLVKSLKSARSCNPQFYQNYDHFNNTSTEIKSKVSCCTIENDHNFDKTEYHATVFLE